MLQTWRRVDHWFPISREVGQICAGSFTQSRMRTQTLLRSQSYLQVRAYPADCCKMPLYKQLLKCYHTTSNSLYLFPCINCTVFKLVLPWNICLLNSYFAQVCIFAQAINLIIRLEHTGNWLNSVLCISFHFLNWIHFRQQILEKYQERNWWESMESKIDFCAVLAFQCWPPQTLVHKEFLGFGTV